MDGKRKARREQMWRVWHDDDEDAPALEELLDEHPEWFATRLQATRTLVDVIAMMAEWEEVEHGDDCRLAAVCRSVLDMYDRRVVKG